MKAFEDFIQPQELPGGTTWKNDRRQKRQSEGPNANPRSKLDEKGLELPSPTIEGGHSNN